MQHPATRTPPSCMQDPATVMHAGSCNTYAPVLHAGSCNMYAPCLACSILQHVRPSHCPACNILQHVSTPAMHAASCHTYASLASSPEHSEWESPDLALFIATAFGTATNTAETQRMFFETVVKRVADVWTAYHS